MTDTEMESYIYKATEFYESPIQSTESKETVLALDIQDLMIEFVDAWNAIDTHDPNDQNRKVMIGIRQFIMALVGQALSCGVRLSVPALSRFKGVKFLGEDFPDLVCAIYRSGDLAHWQSAISDAAKEPQQLTERESQPARGRGRPKETLKDKMINDADGSKLQRMHAVMAGKKGKDAALIVLACIERGWMLKPTFTQVTEEFGDIGTQQNFTRYLNEKQFTKEEIYGAMNSFD